ncbi:MAG: hypothetical protein F9K16_07985, partial [Thermoanaerobaculia bacterium]
GGARRGPHRVRPRPRHPPQDRRHQPAPRRLAPRSGRPRRPGGRRCRHASPARGGAGDSSAGLRRRRSAHHRAAPAARPLSRSRCQFPAQAVASPRSKPSAKR